MDSLRHVSPLTPDEVLKVLPGLFWDHDCVMLPGLGGFVCNPRSAWYDEDKHQIVPPSRDVLFNPRLTTNDGVLANELMAKLTPRQRSILTEKDYVATENSHVPPGRNALPAKL